MNRCTLLMRTAPSALRIALLASLLSASCAANAVDRVRPFPPTALRGTLQVVQPPDVLLDGKPARLSPGARIRSIDNTIVMSGSLIGHEIVVHYVRDGQGMLHDVWLLNPTEARQPRPGLR